MLTSSFARYLSLAFVAQSRAKPFPTIMLLIFILAATAAPRLIPMLSKILYVMFNRISCLVPCLVKLLSSQSVLIEQIAAQEPFAGHLRARVVFQ